MEEENHIEFDTDQQIRTSSGQAFTSREVFGQQQVPGMAAWLIRKGIISQESQAKAILVSVVFINFIIAGLILYFFVLK